MTPQQLDEINYYKDITAIRKSLALLNKVIVALPTMYKVGYAPKATEDSDTLISNLSK